MVKLKTFAATIHIGIGDIIYTRGQFDPIKHEYDKIEFHFWDDLLGLKDSNYPKFLNEFGTLLFSEPPYSITDIKLPYMGPMDIMHRGIKPRKPELKHTLCKGKSLDLGCEYIVLTTKLRYFDRKQFDRKSQELFDTIRKLSKKYKIVILGEKIIEMNNEYLHWGSNEIYSIYDDIVKNVPADQLVDLTIPVLGITSPKVSQIQQDCLIMSEAKFVITLGVGGNFCMATAVANTVGFRIDGDILTDMAFDRQYDNAVITKDWHVFVNTLIKYI